MKDEKILEDEILSDEQLEQVAGGTALETAQDSDILRFYGLCHNAYSSSEIGILPVEGQIKAAWAKVGVGFEHHRNANEYFIDGKKVSRSDAYQHLTSVKGDLMTFALNNDTPLPPIPERFPR